MAKKPTYTRCTRVCERDRTISYIDADSGELVAIMLPRGKVVDVRENPPYVAIIPCPYCGAEDDRSHVAGGHVDRELGMVVEGVERLAAWIGKDPAGRE